MRDRWQRDDRERTSFTASDSSKKLAAAAKEQLTQPVDAHYSTPSCSTPTSHPLSMWE